MKIDINQKLSRKELAKEIYRSRVRTKTVPIPIGRSKPLTEKEFVQRYTRGIGGVEPFDKEALQYLLEKELKNEQNMLMKNKNTAKTAPKTVKAPGTSNKSKTTRNPARKSTGKATFSKRATKKHK